MQDSFKLGHNRFSDWTSEEYSATFRQKTPDLIQARDLSGSLSLEFDHFTPERLNDTPSSVNWVDEGAVTEVKDQGSCTAGWAFATAGSLEGADFIASSDLKSLSAQQLIDCDSLFNLGCQGGLPLYSFRYYESNKAILDSDYPWESGLSGEKGSCQYSDMTKTDL